MYFAVSTLNLTHVHLYELNTVYTENIVTANVYSTADSTIRMSMINRSTYRAVVEGPVARDRVGTIRQAERQ